MKRLINWARYNRTFIAVFILAAIACVPFMLSVWHLLLNEGICHL
jgi:hypothetical protein